MPNGIRTIVEQPFIPCTAAVLPVAQWEEAARIAIAQNPANRPPLEALALMAMAFTGTPPILDRMQIAVLATKYWGQKGVKLGVTFLDTQDLQLKNKILAHMNAWGARCNVAFAASASGEVRIARQQGSGYWSYLGTDILSIPAGQATMNLDSFTLDTPESEYKRVVRHETGHTLGCPHEHMRKALVALLDPQKTIDYFCQRYGWSPQITQQQVLTPIEESALLATPLADADSIMCYQLAGACTKSGQPIAGGTDINESDYQWLAKLYPPVVAPPPPPPPVDQTDLILARSLPPGRYKVTPMA